jgi:hypothetical protein
MKTEFHRHTDTHTHTHIFSSVYKLYAWEPWKRAEVVEWAYEGVSEEGGISKRALRSMLNRQSRHDPGLLGKFHSGKDDAAVRTAHTSALLTALAKREDVLDAEEVTLDKSSSNVIYVN